MPSHLSIKNFIKQNLLLRYYWESEVKTWKKLKVNSNEVWCDILIEERIDGIRFIGWLNSWDL